LAGVTLLAALACARDRDMPESVDMKDSMPIVRAIEDRSAADSMLDTIPGGEMVRGDSAAAERLLRDKMPE
jgi:hypothetical protein